MKTLNYVVVLILLLSFSCNKQNETPLKPINKTESKSNFAESTGLFYFDIPTEHQATPNTSISNTEIITEEMELEDGTVLHVTIEHTKSEDGKIISIGVSEEFCAIKEINFSSFITENLEEFNNEYNDQTERDRPNGPLARFFLGRLVKNPCFMGRQNIYRDPWWGPSYSVSGENGDPC